MSHMVSLALAFGRQDLLKKAVEALGYTLSENVKQARYYGGQVSQVDMTVLLRSYDLGFVRKRAESTADDVTEAFSVGSVLTPVYDPWHGEVERVFGKRLCKLSEEYYKELMAESAVCSGAFSTTASDVSVRSTADSIILELEV